MIPVNISNSATGGVVAKFSKFILLLFSHCVCIAVGALICILATSSYDSRFKLEHEEEKTRHILRIEKFSSIQSVRGSSGIYFTGDLPSKNDRDELYQELVIVFGRDRAGEIVSGVSYPLK